MMNTQYDATLPNERQIICYTLYRKNQSDQFGFVQPVAEIVDGNLVQIDASSFCNTMKVFITSHYEDLEKQYPEQKFFQLSIRISGKSSDNVNPELACKYVASAVEASPIRPKDYFEILRHPLPPANRRIVDLDELPGTQYVFLQDAGGVYGPFQWSRASRDEDNTSITIDFIDAPLPSVVLTQYQTYKIDSAKINPVLVKTLVNNRFVMKGLSNLQGASYLDYASDDEVVRYCTKIAGDQGQRILERARVEALVAHVRRNPKLDNEFNRNRLARMSEIADISLAVRDEVTKAMSSFLNGEAGRPIVQGFIEQNESVFIERLRKERADQIEKDLCNQVAEVSKAEARVAELTDKKNGLNAEIQRLAEERDKGADLSQIYAQSDEELKAKRMELAAVEAKIQSISQTYKLTVDIEKLNDEVKVLERERDKAKERRDEVEAHTKSLEITMNEKNSELQKRMAELKPFVDAINGSFSSTEPEQESIGVVTRELVAGTTMIRQKAVVESIQAALAGRGRHLKEHEVANLLITTQQSFLTIFAGLPGTGKTSLARLLADVQNSRQRLREVAVSRGWTSQKDLIGYYNPLTSRFQPASTGMYRFLKAVGGEADPNRAMAFILLDEANLSPIEHYWSAFMGLTDNEADRRIILGNETIYLPENLRFIATINYDGTTEPLSPRLINRAPIIVLETPDDMSDVKSVHAEVTTGLPVSATAMKELFGVAVKTPELEGSERSVYDQIKRVLLDDDQKLGRPVSISPRKENAVQQYCAKARLLMNIDNDMMALDFAVRQHIIPLIQGNGTRFGKRLESLHSLLLNHDLPESARILQRMITFGEADLQTYDFFCW